MALGGNISAPIRVTDLVEASKDAASLLVCTRKQNFCLGVAGFFDWRHKWRTFGRQPLGGSILLKFLLETRLESESFEPMIDFLAFLV